MKDSPDVRWEYTLLQCDDNFYFEEKRNSFIEGVNELGLEGWELVMQNGSGWYFFKRRLQ